MIDIQKSSEAALKAIKVIRSCRTLEQFNSANQYIFLHYRKFRNITDFEGLIRLWEKKFLILFVSTKNN